METTNNKLSEDVTMFFIELSKYINTPLFFYGSVQRSDYFPGSSDIDIDIFTDNQHSLITKLLHFLQIDKRKFKRFVWRIHNNVVIGYKVMYKNPDKNIAVEFSIYNEKDKKSILDEHRSKFVLPFYVSILLIILKFIHYKLCLLNKNTFKNIKRIMLSTLMNLPYDDFYILE
jgi:hypothetical protein